MTVIDGYAFFGCSSLTDITFTGDAPYIDANAFVGVTAAAFYPGGNETWTSDVMQNYGGTLTWKPYCEEHAGGEWIVTTNPTCTKKGEETRTCAVCKATETREIDAQEHQWDDGVITTEPTQDAEGEKTYTCEVCGETKTESVPPVESGEPDEPDEPDDPEKPVDPENPSVPVTPVKPLWRSWLEKFLERLPRWWK